MHDPRLDRLADVLVRYSTRVKKGDLVAIRADPSAMPLIEATFTAVLKAGGHPTWVTQTENLHELLLTHGSDEQISFLSPWEVHRIETADVQIAFWSEQNTSYLAKIDAGRVAKYQAGRKAFMSRFMERAASGAMRWVGTQYPTQACAQNAEMSLTQYADFVYRAGLLHLPDPVAAWEKVHASQEQVREYLQRRKALRFRVPPPPDGSNDGTDLRVDVSKGVWVNCAGRENFPDGEVFAGPTGVDGHVNYTFPAVYNGQSVDGVRLVFKGGRVVEATARRNEDFLHKMLSLDAGAKTLGEIAIGTNYGISQFTKNTLFDEKIGGTFHAAVGAGYPESGNSNVSGLHWDMVCELRPTEGRAGGTIEADGEVFHKDGKFVLPGWPGN